MHRTSHTYVHIRFIYYDIEFLYQRLINCLSAHIISWCNPLQLILSFQLWIKTFIQFWDQHVSSCPVWHVCGNACALARSCLLGAERGCNSITLESQLAQRRSGCWFHVREHLKRTILTTLERSCGYRSDHWILKSWLVLHSLVISRHASNPALSSAPPEVWHSTHLGLPTWRWKDSWVFITAWCDMRSCLQHVYNSYISIYIYFIFYEEFLNILWYLVISACLISKGSFWSLPWCCLMGGRRFWLA